MSTISGLNVARVVRYVSELFHSDLVLTDEEDQWFEKTYQHLDEVEKVISQLQHYVEDLSYSRKGQAKSSIDMSRSVSALALCEENTGLSLALDKLADLHANASSMQNYDAEMDYLLVRSFVDQIQRIRHFKSRIVSRSKTWKNLNENEMLLKHKVELKTLNQLACKTSRVEKDKKEISELEKHIATLTDDLSRKDTQIRADYEEFAKARLADLKKTFINWLGLLEETEQKTLDNWQGLVKCMEDSKI